MTETRRRNCSACGQWMQYGDEDVCCRCVLCACGHRLLDHSLDVSCACEPCRVAGCDCDDYSEADDD